MKFFYIIFFFCLGITQSWDNHPELNWKTFETEHFVFYFHEGTQRSALEASKVAEIIYEPVTSLYDFYPTSKTAIILKDTDDYSNGAAMFFDNKIEIWTKPMDLDLRGNHRWIQDVLTHEFVHIIQLGSAIKFSETLPAIYVQYIDYEDEKRDDVLYGYPNKIISAPIPGTSVPPWFAEGVAQYMYNNAYYDFWDSQRDMILRDAILNDKLFTYDEMNTFGKKGIGNENVYNQGFAFVNYFVEQFGEKVLKDITDKLSKPSMYSIERAFKEVTKHDIRSIFSDFKVSLSKKYSNYKEKSNNNIIFIESDGTSNINPIWAKDSKSLLFLSDKDNDFFNKTDLYLYNFDDDKSVKLVSGVKGTPSWINDSIIIYSKISIPDKYGSKFFDIYQYNINSEEEERLTYGKRLFSPSYNEKLNKIVAVNQYDGSSNIVLSNFSESLDFKAITNYNNGFQIFNVDWMNSDILFDAVLSHGRDIYKISLSGDDEQIIYKEHYNERDPFFDKHLNVMIWSDDREKAFNLYYQNLNDNNIYRLTNLAGGAFYPAVSTDGRLAFSVFDKGSYHLVIMENFTDLDTNISNIGFDSDWDLFLEETHAKTKNIIQTGTNERMEYNNYVSDKMNTLILPRLFVDYQTVKPGFYMISTDVLQKLSIFSGGSINNKKDLDLFIMFENYSYQFTPYVNVFWVTRNKEISSFYIDGYGIEHQNTPISNEYLFNLFSLDVGSRFNLISDSEVFPGRHKFWINYQFNNYREKVEQTIHQYNQIGEIDFYDNFDFSFDYYRSHIISFEYKYAKQKNHYMKNILPSHGYDVRLKLSYEFNDFLNGFGIYEDSGTFGSILSPNNTLRFELDFNKAWSLNSGKGQKVSIVSSTSVGYISKDNIDDFFYFFGGGMPGLKGYTYYDDDLKGANKILESIYIRTPIFKEKSIHFLSSYFQHMTFGVVLQAGNVWGGNPDYWPEDYIFRDTLKLNDFKTSAGIEIRLFGYNVYAYPLAITYEHHIVENIDDGKHYFKILFDF